MCMHVCGGVCAYECSYPRDQVTLELEFQEVDMNAGHQTQVVVKGSMSF